MWVRFLRDYRFRPPEKCGVTIAYKAGMVEFVRGVCGQQAIAEGKAVSAVRPA